MVWLTIMSSILLGNALPLKMEEHQRFEEILLLAEVQPVFLRRDLEGFMEMGFSLE